MDYIITCYLLFVDAFFFMMVYVLAGYLVRMHRRREKKMKRRIFWKGYRAGLFGADE